MRHLRYEGARLDDVLARIRADHGADANIVSADLVRTGGIAGFFTKETYRVMVNPDAPRRAEVAHHDAGADQGIAPAADPAADDDPDLRFARLLAELIEDDGHTDTVELSGLSEPSGPVAPRRGLLPPLHPAADPRLATPPPSMRAAPIPAEVEEIIDLVDSQAEARPHGPGDPVEIAELLARVTARMQSPPPVIRTGILAIIGAKSDAVRAAVSVSESLGARASDVLVAAPGLDPAVDSPASMADFIREHALHRAARGVTGPTVVAVIVMPGLGGHRWATDLINAVAPTQTRLAVAGWRPVDRLEQTIAGLGGVDVVDLVDSGRATEPERFLDLTVPVGMIDGRRATPTIWAATLASAGRAGAVATTTTGPTPDDPPVTRFAAPRS